MKGRAPLWAFAWVLCQLQDEAVHVTCIMMFGLGWQLNLNINPVNQALCLVVYGFLKIQGLHSKQCPLNYACLQNIGLFHF